MDFFIPSTELIPEHVRSKVKDWSDYIDYRAVDKGITGTWSVPGPKRATNATLRKLAFGWSIL